MITKVKERRWWRRRIVKNEKLSILNESIFLLGKKTKIISIKKICPQKLTTNMNK